MCVRPASAPSLSPLQAEGAAWMQTPCVTGIHVKGLFDDMGVGKTAQTIEAARQQRLTRCLIICPLIARETVWPDEWKRFWPDDPSPFTEMKTIDQEIPDDGHIVCTFEFARRRHADLFIWGRYDALIIDEWHEVRGTKAARTYAIFHPEQGLAARADRVWLLTGTPIANNLVELYTLLRLAGVYTHSLDAFVRRYCTTYYDPDRGQLKITGSRNENLHELHKLLDESNVVLRRTKKQAMPDLPPLVYEYIEVPKGEVDLEELFPDWDMSEKMRTLVEEVEFQRNQAWGVLNPDAPVEKLSFTQGVERLQMLSESVPELMKLTGMQKVAAVIAIIKAELKAGLYPKVYLITRHTVVGEALFHGLSEFNPVWLHGGTRNRKKLVDTFTNDDTCQVFIGQVRACGPAVNLAANGKCWEVCLVEQSPVPGENSQAITRPHRPPCWHEVRVRVFLLDDPVDRRWEELVFSKNFHISKVMREDPIFSKEFDPING